MSKSKIRHTLSFIVSLWELKCKDKSAAYTPALGVGIVEVVKATYVFDVEELEDVVKAYVSFHVGAFVVHRTSDGREVTRCVKGAREVVEVGTVGILIQERIVLRGEVSPECAEPEVFTQLKVLDKGDAVKDFSVQFPRTEECCVAVVEKFHVSQ